ncbi:MAG TPA: hypothetical protein VE442_00240 [Jatrophihabitans sp.]|jgi:hypothetical protein|nr:hypothetical protein [Jatrophihabitans sp.]
MVDETYVTHAAWVRQVGRPDLIDEVADQFERPAGDGAESFWSRRERARWTCTSRGWRAKQRILRLVG